MKKAKLIIGLALGTILTSATVSCWNTKQDNSTKPNNPKNPVDSDKEKNPDKPTKKVVKINFTYNDSIIKTISKEIGVDDQIFSMSVDEVPNGYKTNVILSNIEYSETVNIPLLKNIKVATLEFNYAGKTVGQFKIDIESTQETVKIDGVPHGYQLADNQELIVPYSTESISVNVVPLTKIANITYVYQSREIEKQIIDVPFKSNVIERDSLLIPNGYRLESQEMTFEYQENVRLELVEIEKTADINLTINFTFEQNTISTETVVVPNNTNQINVEKYVPQNYRLAQGQDKVVAFKQSNSINVPIVPIIKTATIRFLNGTTEVKSVNLELSYYDDAITIDPNLIPYNYESLSALSNITYKPVIEIHLSEKANVAPTKKLQINYTYNDNSIEKVDIQIDSSVEEINLNEHLPQGYVLAESQEQNVPYTQDLITAKIVPDHKTINIVFLKNNQEIAQKQITVPHNSTQVSIDPNLIPEGYLTNDQLQNLPVQDTIQIHLTPKAQEESIMTLNFVYNSQTLNSLNIKAQDNQETIDLSSYELPQNYQFAQGQSSTIAFSNGTVEVQIVPLNKNVLIYWEDEKHSKVAENEITIPYYNQTFDIHESMVPKGYTTTSPLKGINYTPNIKISLVTQTKTLLINFVNGSQTVGTVNEKIPFNVQTINLNDYLPKGYTFKNSDNSQAPYQEETITVEVVSETNNNQSNSKIEQINSLKANVELIKTHLDYFNNDSTLESKINAISFDSLESKSDQELTAIIESINDTFNQASLLIKGLLTPLFDKYQELESGKYYLEDFKNNIDQIKNWETLDTLPKITEFINNYDQIGQLTTRMNDFKVAADSINLTDTNFYLSLSMDYPLENGTYEVGDKTEIDVKVTIKKTGTDENYELKYIHQILNNNTTELGYRYARRGPRTNINLTSENVNYETSEITLPFSSVSGNDEVPVHLWLGSLTKDSSYTIFVRRGIVVDNTPTDKEVNSLDDYWMFPVGYEFEFVRKSDTDWSGAQKIINNNINSVWNKQTSNQSNFSYKDALWIMFLKVFQKLTFENNPFTINSATFTSPFDSNGNFTYTITATVNSDFNTNQFPNLGGKFFEFSYVDTTGVGVAHQQLHTGDKVVMTLSLENANGTFSINNNAGNRLPSLSGAEYNLSSLTGAKAFVGKIPGLFRMQLAVNNNQVWNVTTDGNDITNSRSNQSDTLPIFVIQKNDNAKKIYVYVL